MIFFKYILIGLLGSGLLIVLAKGILAHLLQREEDYYIDTYESCKNEDNRDCRRDCGSVPADSCTFGIRGGEDDA